MNKRELLILAAAGLLLVLSLALHFGTSKVEADISQRAQEALQEQFAWVDVGISGRDLLLSGNAPSESAADQALATVSELEGVRRVGERFSFESAEQVTAEQEHDETSWSTAVKPK